MSTKSHLSKALQLTVSAIHLAPSLGILGASTLQRLYGVNYSNEATTLLLMRHRAVLFGILGALIGTAAFVPELQGVADVGGLVSIVSFLGLERMHAGHGNARVDNVVRMDWIALVCQIGSMLLRE